jgi:hypothetical protein
VSVYLREAADVERAVELLRLSFDRASESNQSHSETPY